MFVWSVSNFRESWRSRKVGNANDVPSSEEPSEFSTIRKMKGLREGQAFKLWGGGSAVSVFKISQS